jgi:hypothetical protein
MNAVMKALEELIGLFVEDGSLAIAIIVWIGVAALLFPHLPGGISWRAPVLFLGLGLLLFENVWRSARKR